ncbi:MAG: VOC family protein [Myxococcota bacterium]|nr:VOC family protein [Myxococcota bacterium]
MRIHHVQLMIPRGREAEALAFYRDGLGLTRIPKPADMPNPEGIWFALAGGELHLGVQDEPPLETRAHVALEVDALDATLARLEGARTKASSPVAGLRRVHVWDPFGNRLELMGR